MTGKEIQTQIQYASQVVGSWPAWKRNILSHSSQPTNSLARTPVDNHSVISSVKNDNEQKKQAEVA